jgi:3-oxoadipate enol-lactonase
MTVVMLHPVGLNGLTWQFTPLPSDLSWVGPTMLWHGDRARPAVELTIASFAEDVLANLGGPFDLVGVSMGGAVAQAIALRHPDRVRSLMLVASTAGGRGGASHRERAAVIEEHGIDGILDSTLERWFSSAVVAAGTDPGYRYARDALLALDPQSFASSWLALGEHDTTADLGRLSMPTTVLHPADDASSTLETKERMVELIPSSRLVVAEGPHMIQLERPEVFGAEVQSHLAWSSSRRRA